MAIFPRHQATVRKTEKSSYLRFCLRKKGKSIGVESIWLQLVRNPYFDIMFVSIQDSKDGGKKISLYWLNIYQSEKNGFYSVLKGHFNEKKYVFQFQGQTWNLHQNVAQKLVISSLLPICK